MRDGGRKKFKFWRRCCRREVYAVVVSIILAILFALAILLPWYEVAATALPKPWDSMTALFWWNGMEAVYSPPLYGNERALTIGWSTMSSTTPKNVYMACMAMSILGLAATLLVIGAILVGFILRNTIRSVSIMFRYQFKWVVVFLCFVVLALSLGSWATFFAFNTGLHNAGLCPGTLAYGSVSIFPSNDTYIEPMFCDSFANSRIKGTADWVWGPQVGWFFALFTTPLSCAVLWIMLTVHTGSRWEAFVHDFAK